nr:tissue factor pathway inhibitor-like [Desmodus rotundus]
MKIKPIFGVSVCLLLTYASLPLNAENHECSNTLVRGTSTQPVTVSDVPVTPTPPTRPTTLVYEGPSWCHTPADRGLCKVNITRFYYNSVTRKCLPFNYSGCGGNENNFTSKKACRKACKKGFIK